MHVLSCCDCRSIIDPFIFHSYSYQKFWQVDYRLLLWLSFGDYLEGPGGFVPLCGFHCRSPWCVDGHGISTPSWLWCAPGAMRRWHVHDTMPTKSHFRVTTKHSEALPANKTGFRCLHSLFRLVLEDGFVFCHHNFAKQLMFQACTTAALNYIDVAKGVASIYSDLHVSRGW